MRSPLQRPACRAAPLVLILALAAPCSGHAQRQPPPPEPSREAWISFEAAEGLGAAITRYRGIASAGGWQALPSGIVLRREDRDAHVALLRRHLALTGDIAADAGGADLFDEALEAGVRRYQMRNGIPPTGVVAEMTLRALNTPAGERLRQLELNLARMQELLPRLDASRYVLVNAASFELQGVAGGEVAVTSRVIAGKRGTPTPAFSASVQAINLLPYWHVPGGIAKRSVIPAVRKDVSYLYRERIRVFSTFGGEEIDPSLVNWWGPEADRYLFRQDPGPHNALGVIRFDMPNRHVVYLHDTPTKTLYEHFERAYSSGCVRTQNFLDVAEWMLAGQQGWTRPALENAIAGGRAKTIKLAEPMPIHLIYLTAWVQDGLVHFRNDVYSRDETAVDQGEAVTERPWITTIGP